MSSTLLVDRQANEERGQLIKRYGSYSKMLRSVAPSGIGDYETTAGERGTVRRPGVRAVAPGVLDTLSVDTLRKTAQCNAAKQASDKRVRTSAQSAVVADLLADRDLSREGRADARADDRRNRSRRAGQGVPAGYADPVGRGGQPGHEEVAHS